MCVPCFYDAGCFVVRSCVRSCIFFLFFLFFLAVFLLHRVKKKRTTTPPSFFFFCFLFLRAQWIKWIIVASCECVQTQHTQLKTLGHFKKEKRNSIQKRTRIPERFHLKNISVCVWCPTLSSNGELMLIMYFSRNVSHQESRHKSRVLFAT